MTLSRQVLLSLCMLGALAASPAQAQDARALFDQGNRLYLEQKYPEAIQAYQSVLNAGLENSELYFNLGNAYYRSGKLGEAILAYERAHKLAPNDEDVQFNLQYANLKIVDKIEPVPTLFIYRWAEGLLALFSPGTQLALLYISFLLALASFAWLMYARSFNARRIALLAGLVATLWCLVSAAFYGINTYRASTNAYGIVMSDVSTIKSAPDPGSNDVFVLHTGVKVQMMDTVNGWKKIRLADGKVGWIREGEVETI
ncbi:MAG: tetratricopeptide repeat protein [Acidobacteriota bacterium]